MIENLKKFYKKTTFIIEFLLSILLGVFVLQLLWTKQETGAYSFNILFKLILIGLPLLTIIITNFYYYRKDIAKIFLTAIIPIGLLYIFVLLPDGIPDERAHYLRIYDVSMGNIITPLGEDGKGRLNVPLDLEECRTENITNYADVHKQIKLESNYKEMVQVEETTKTYSALPYIPGAIVCAICRLFSVNMVVLIYLIRIINFIVSITLIYLAIKIVPFGKLLFAVYSFTPMFIQQIASASFDSMLHSIIMLFIAYSMYLMYRKKDLNLKDRLIYYILCIGIALCKYVYIPIIFINIFLLANKNIEKKNAVKLIIVSILISVLVAGAWFVFTSRYPDERQVIIERQVNAKEQVKQIIESPTEFLNTFTNTIKDKGEYYLYTFVGSLLGWLDIGIPTRYIIAFIVLLLGAPFFENHEYQFNRKEKLWCIFIGIGIFVLVLVGLYLTWTTVGASIIEGVQGRYFIPIVILLLLTLCMKNNYVKVKNINVVFMVLVMILNILTLNVVQGFYII